jgi:hypothetical protein
MPALAARRSHLEHVGHLMATHHPFAPQLAETPTHTKVVLPSLAHESNLAGEHRNGFGLKLILGWVEDFRVPDTCTYCQSLG